MISFTKKQYNDLKEKALVALRKKTTNEFINQIDLYNTELEVQNEDLRSSLAAFDNLRHKYNELYRSLPIPYLLLDESGRILEINEQGAKVLGLNLRSLSNQFFFRYVIPCDQHEFITLKKKILNLGGKDTVKVKFLRRNGPLFDAWLTCKLSNELDGAKRLIVFINPIDCLQTTSQPFGSKSDSSMGELASAMVYELNNPMAIITNYLSGCLIRLKNNKVIRDDLIYALTKANHQVQRIAEVILRMKNYSCKGKLHFEKIEINKVLEEIPPLLFSDVENTSIKIKYLGLKQTVLANVDSIHIQQAILNIARNGIESIKEANLAGGCLTIETNIQNQVIEISITNNGPPISEKNLSLLFQPDFTTKAYGVGLGLAITRNIVESHKGIIQVKSDSIGTTFKIILPRHIDLLKIECSNLEDHL